MFRNEKKRQSAGQIDFNFLKIFGLLHCAGTRSDKGKHLYALLQEGGLDRHKNISANDKDFKPVFEKMCSFATWELFTAARQISGINEIYSENDKIKLQEQVEVLREDVFLEQIFGDESRLENNDFLKAISKHSWCFCSVNIRKKLFGLAGIG